MQTVGSDGKPVIGTVFLMGGDTYDGDFSLHDSQKPGNIMLMNYQNTTSGIVYNHQECVRN